ncbi:hypothetical protein AVEN_220324-1, partial [Araneus ventricosus]
HVASLGFHVLPKTFPRLFGSSSEDNDILADSKPNLSRHRSSDPPACDTPVTEQSRRHPKRIVYSHV